MDTDEWFLGARYGGRGGKELEVAITWPQGVSRGAGLFSISSAGWKPRYTCVIKLHIT